MAKQSIVKIAPQKAGFFDGKFSKDVGGYNWYYDRELKVIKRRPGTETFAEIPSAAQVWMDSVAYDTAVLAVDANAPWALDGAACFIPRSELGVVSAANATTYQYEALRLASFETASTLTYANGLTAKDVLGIVITDSAWLVFNTGAVIELVKPRSNQYVSTLPTSFDRRSYTHRNLLQSASVQADNLTSNIPAGWVTGTRTWCVLGSAAYSAGMHSPLLRVDIASVTLAGGVSTAIREATSFGPTTGGALSAGDYTYYAKKRIYRADGTYVDGAYSLLGTFTATPGDAGAIVLYQTDLQRAPQTLQGNPVRVGADSDAYETSSDQYVPLLGTSDLLVETLAGTEQYETIALGRNSNGTLTTRGAYTVLPGLVLISTNSGSTTNVTNISALYSLRTDTPQRIVGQQTTVGLSGPTEAGSLRAISDGEVVVLGRTVANGTLPYEAAYIPGVWFKTYVNGVTSNTPAFLDTLPDTDIQQNALFDLSPDPTPYGHIAVTSCCCTHQQRVVVGADLRTASPEGARCTSIIWSEPFVETFAADNTLNLSADCDQVVGLASAGGDLYVLTDTGVLIVQGDLIDPTTFRVGRVSGSTACAAGAAVQVVNNSVLYLDTTGNLVVINGNRVESISNVLPPSATNLLAATSCVNADKQTVHFFSPDIAYFVAPINPANTENYPVGTRGWEVRLDLVTNQITSNRTVAAIGGAAVIDGTMYTVTRNGDLTSTVVKHVEDLGTDFDGRTVKMRVEAPYEDADTPHLQKQFTRLTTFAPDTDSAFDLSVTIERDWGAGAPIQQFTQTFAGGDGYGVDPYGSDLYGDAAQPAAVVSLNNLKAKSLRVTYTHENADEQPCLSGWTLEYNDAAREGRED